MNYIYVIDKPKGWTSNDVVQKIKHHFAYRKVGHGGTLDPNATGVLVIGYNEGTKLLTQFITNDKEYEAQIQFGIQTDTFDITGKIINQKLFNHISKQSIETALKYFQNNEYWQTPPMFSAKKVNGQKLYQLARNNKSINIKPQLVKLINFQIMGFNHGVLKLTLTVSKGFYIRSLANDLGAKLQSCATLIELKRTKSGQFHIIDSITMDQLLKDKKRYE